MKTHKEVLEDIKFVIDSTEKGKKPRISAHLSLLNAAKFGNKELVVKNRDELKLILDKLDSIFPEYLENFTEFRLKNEKAHYKKVLSIFKKELDYNKKMRNLNRLNYLLGELDSIYIS